MGAELRVPLIATNDALYATPAQRPLHDILTCIREKTSIAQAGRRLAANAERHLKPPAEMARLFRDCPQAVAETTGFLSRIGFTLDDLRYEYPHEPVPEGWRSEEHTSELQSLMRISYAVFCLKKKKINTYNQIRYTSTLH